MTGRVVCEHHRKDNASTTTLTQPTTQRRQQRQHATSHTNTHKHTQHRHIALPSFHLQHRYRPTSFQVARGLHRNTWTFFLRDANMFAQTGNGPRSMHSGLQRKSESWTSAIVIVIENRERERTKEQRQRER